MASEDAYSAYSRRRIPLTELRNLKLSVFTPQQQNCLDFQNKYQINLYEV